MSGMAMASLHWTVLCLLLSILNQPMSALSFSHTRTLQEGITYCPDVCTCFTNNSALTISVRCTTTKDLDFHNDNLLITSLDLSNTSITVLNKTVANIFNLETLNLTQNEITDLVDFPKLPKLRYLYLGLNKIKTIPVRYLPSNLEYLDISHNYIRELPDDILKLEMLTHLDISGNPFNCDQKSLDVRDSLLERRIKLIGPVICNEPENFKGKSWIHAVDFDEFFKIHDRDDYQGDEGSGSGDYKSEIITDLFDTTTDSDFIFEGSGTKEKEDESTIPPPKKFVPYNAEPTTTFTPLDSTTVNAQFDNNIGIKIFLVLFLICLIALLIYSVKQNKDNKRAARRLKKYLENQDLELKSSNPAEKPVTYTDTIPVTYGKNGNTVVSEAETEILSKSTPKIAPEPEVVKSVTVRRSEIPDSVPHTPILITRSKSSDGKHIVVTPSSPNHNRIP